MYFTTFESFIFEQYLKVIRLAIEAIKVPKAPMFAPRSMSFEFCMNKDNKSVAGTLEMN